jgi:hypothetical protein
LLATLEGLQQRIPTMIRVTEEVLAERAVAHARKELAAAAELGVTPDMCLASLRGVLGTLRPLLQRYSLLVPPGVFAWYKPETWSEADGEWRDASGNGHVGRCTEGRATTLVQEGHGVERPLAAVTGQVRTSMDFGPVIAHEFTIASVSRYTGGACARILNGSRSNWLHAHWGNGHGVAHYDGWKTDSKSTVPGAKTDWVLMIGQNGGEGILRANGQEVGSGLGGSGNQNLMINAGQFGNEQSDWAVSEVITWDRALSREEILEVESYLYLRLGWAYSDTAGATGSAQPAEQQLDQRAMAYLARLPETKRALDLVREVQLLVHSKEHYDPIPLVLMPEPPIRTATGEDVYAV